MAGRRFFIISVLVLALNAAIVFKGEVYDKCKLIQELKDSGVVGIKNYTIADYLCLIHYVSGYDTALHASKSEYGIFQINTLYWCDDGKTVGRMNLCGVNCTEFLDKNITNDIQCFARILKDPKGIEAWDAWSAECEGKNLSKFTSGC